MNSCYLTLHVLHSCVLSLICFYQIHLHLCFMCFESSVLESQSDDWKSPAFRVEGRTFVVVNGAFPLKVWRFPWKRCRSGLKDEETASWAEGRCSRYGGAIFAHFVCWELTYLFWNIFLFFRFFFDRCSQLRKFIEVFIFLSFQFGKVLITLTYYH